VSLSSSGATFKGLGAWKVTGGVFSSLDKSNALGSQSTATPSTGTTGALTLADELAVAAYGWDGSQTFTEPAGWSNASAAGTKMTTTSTVLSGALVWLETSSGSALNPAATLSASTTDCGTIGTYIFQVPTLPPDNKPAVPLAARPTLPGGVLQPQRLVVALTAQQSQPTADNATGGWTRGGTDSGTLWGQVDEPAPGDDSDYITASSS
jgi:hypothetical protein